jgi:hypothetical protein
MTQTIITFIIIGLAVGFSICKIYKSFTGKGNSCSGCGGCSKGKEEGTGN